VRPANTLYRGERRTDATGGITAHVTVFPRMAGVRGHAMPIAPSLRLRSHSPTGFEWGYLGSGPAQLALALLLDAAGDKAVALRHYHSFKWEVVQFWGERWQITVGEVLAWVERREAEERQQNEAKPIAPFVVVEGGAP
jgi:hypothetical protein